MQKIASVKIHIAFQFFSVPPVAARSQLFQSRRLDSVHGLSRPHDEARRRRRDSVF